ncbi:alpha/beta hydrolase [Candidatus Binatia bacterium]|nr:alpha/beta hydrolase [Candidatus Binatia bacterium]
MQRLIDAWFDLDRPRPRLYRARTRDGWLLALYRYEPRGTAHRTPVILCHGMSSNRWDMDGPGRVSIARYLARRGYDAWVIELRGAGRSTRPSLLNGKRYDWTFEDYVQHDAPAALQKVLHETGARQVHWVGHSMGGMIAYALLMTPAQGKIASAVTLGSPTMSDVGHPLIDFGLPYRWLLGWLPDRVPLGTLARFGAPFAAMLNELWSASIAELGWYPGNADVKLLRTLMLTAVDDLPASLLREFAQWYETKHMSDRYAMFDFTDHLERISTPLLIVAGSKDGLTPARDLERVYRRVGARHKRFCIVGKQYGFAHDYSHADLVLGLHAPDDVYPVVLDWLESCRQAPAQEPAKPRRARVTRLRPAAARRGSVAWRRSMLSLALLLRARVPVVTGNRVTSASVVVRRRRA